MRAVLLKSNWFADAIGGEVPKAAEAYQPEGVVVLPPLPQAAKPESIKATLRLVHRRLGSVGRQAICAYAKKANLDDESGALQLVESVFGLATVVEGGRSSRAKNKGRGKVGCAAQGGRGVGR